jgi:hypothetical protein
MTRVIDATEVLGLRPLDEDSIIALLEEHPKYLHNPLTQSERGLIRDIVRVACPLSRSPTNLSWQIEGQKP